MKKFDVGMEIGTTNTKIFFKNKSAALNMPSVVAVKKNSNKLVGVGKAAYKMLGKAPKTIVVKKTISRGVVCDLKLNKIMLKEALNKMIGKNSKKFKMCICYHSFMTDLEKLTFKNSIFSLKNSKTYLIDESLASALGAGLDFSSGCSFLIANIGGGATDIAIVSKNGILFNESIQIGSEYIDEIIYKNLEKNYNFLIGKVAAEIIKKTAVTLFEPTNKIKYILKGKDKVTGFPKILELTQEQICANVSSPMLKIINSIEQTIKQASAETAADIEKKGIILAGGGALIPGLKELISKKIGIKSSICKNPLNCAAFGALNSTSFFDDFSQFIIPA